jgi:glycosyltransferase involved in cell wall biosynthesis
MEKMSLSIVVPCRNTARHLERLLDSLVSQQVAEPSEILVVDNDSTDETALVAQQVRRGLPVRLVSATERRSAAYARNVGARSAFGQKLLFVDADDDVERGYVASMAGALCGHQLVTSRVDSVTLNAEWVRAAHGMPWQADGLATFFDFLPATGVNIGIWRPLFERLGGFSEELEPSEDIALTWRAQLAGVPLHFVPDALYRYRYRDTLVELFRQSRRWGTSNVLLYEFFRDAGMPGRTMARSTRDWLAAVDHFLRARTKSDLAAAVVMSGYCVGRFWGSVTHRQRYL